MKKKTILRRLIATTLAVTCLLLCACTKTDNNTQTTEQTNLTEPTVEPTTPSTETPTEKPTEAPTAPPTEQTTKPTDPPTEQPTEVPTAPPTEPTEPPVYFKEVNQKVCSTGDVNIRKGPGTKYESIGLLKHGKEIARTGIGDNGWSRVVYNGEEAYIYSDYLISFPIKYSDETCSIKIDRIWYENAWCYVATINFTDYSRFTTTCANGRYDNGYERTTSVAKRMNAILAVNGCNSAPYLHYGVIRNGVVCNDKKYGYVAGYSSKSGLFGDLVKDKYNGPSLTELAETKVVTDTFCFGPEFLVDGKISDSKDTSRAQRTFMGTNGNPGHLVIVVSSGRYVDGDSSGLTYKQCAQLLKDYGCTYGIPLDGGGSSTMVFNGKILNPLSSEGERALVDFLCFKRK